MEQELLRSMPHASFNGDIRYFYIDCRHGHGHRR
jgi:hypothetical protein